MHQEAVSREGRWRAAGAWLAKLGQGDCNSSALTHCMHHTDQLRTPITRMMTRMQSLQICAIWLFEHATSDRIWLDQSTCRLDGAVGRQHSLLCQGLKARSTSSPARRKAQPSNSGRSHPGSNDIVSVVSASLLSSNYRLSLQEKEKHRGKPSLQTYLLQQKQPQCNVWGTLPVSATKARTKIKG